MHWGKLCFSFWSELLLIIVAWFFELSSYFTLVRAFLVRRQLSLARVLIFTVRSTMLLILISYCVYSLEICGNLKKHILLAGIKPNLKKKNQVFSQFVIFHIRFQLVFLCRIQYIKYIEYIKIYWEYMKEFNKKWYNDSRMEKWCYIL